MRYRTLSEHSTFLNLAVVMVLTTALPAAKAQSPKCQADIGIAETAAPLLVQPTVNGEMREVIALRYLGPDGPLYIAETELSQWGIPVESLNLYSFSGARWLCVEDHRIQYQLDASQLTLSIDFPVEMFSGTQTTFAVVDNVPLTQTPGGFFNYDLRYDHTAEIDTLGANWEVGAFYGQGLLTSSFFSGNNQQSTIRLDSAFRRDDQKSMTSFVAGDTITRSGSYGASVRLGGLQFQRNFGTAPLLITYPLTGITGTAVVPSTVDIYIDNARAYSGQIEPGPFSVANLPVPTGAGNVRVVTRDLFGKESTVIVPYVRYDDMLRKGLHDFSYEVGLLRQNYAIDSNEYGDWAAVATHRYGITDWLTVEAHAEGMADRGNVGGLIQVTMPVLGLVGFGGAVSSGLGKGTLGKAFFQRNERNWSIGAAVQEQSNNYVDISYEPGQIRTLGMYQVSASARLGKRHWLNLLGFRSTDRTGEFNTATLGWTMSLTPSITLTAGASQFWGNQPKSTAYMLTLAVPLGERDYATVSVEQSIETPDVLDLPNTPDKQSTDAVLTLSRNLLENNSFGYHLLAAQESDSRRWELGAYWQTGVGQFGLEAVNYYGLNSARAYARGGFATVGGEFRISRYLDESFAIVKVGDFPGVQVYANNQPIGKTDRHGVVVVPRLSGFLTNAIAFEAEDIPLDGAFGQNVKPVKIASRMGARVDMDVVRVLSATLTLQQADGQPVPAGATVRIGDADQDFPVAKQGRVYVSGLDRNKPNILNVRIGDRACRATLTVPDKFTSGETLGPFQCQ